MTTAAQATFGAVLRLADTGGTPAVVAELTNISIPGKTRSTVDVTTHDSTGGAREFIGEGLYDSGEVSVQGFYIGGSTEDDLFIAALTSGTVQDFEIDVPAAAGAKERYSGSAILTEYAPDGQELEGAATFSATLKVTGPVTQAAVV